jgi:uncharacterized protein
MLLTTPYPLLTQRAAVASRTQSSPLVKPLLADTLTIRFGQSQLEREFLASAEAGYTERLLQLLPVVNINTRDEFGRTALTLAAISGDSEAVTQLIEANADLEIADKGGMTALMWAAATGHEKITKLLVDAQTDLEKQDDSKYTAVMHAIHWPKVLKILIDATADLEKQSIDNNMALKLAAQFGMTESLQLLLQAKPSLVNLPTPESGALAIRWAVLNRNKECLKLLIDTGANLDWEDYAGNTAIMWAVRLGHTEIMNLLLNHDSTQNTKADVNKQNNNGETAVMVAVQQGRSEALQLLLQAGADLALKNKNGKTAAMLAAELGQTEALTLIEEALKKQGA